MSGPGWLAGTARVLGMCVAFAALITGGSLIVTGWRPPENVLRTFGIGLVFSLWCGGLCWLTLPKIAPWLWKRCVPIRWAGLIAAMLAAGVLGTIGGAATLYFGFGFPPRSPFGGFLAAALRSAVPITLLGGIAITVVEMLRARLHVAETQAREQQLERERAQKLAAEAQFASLASRVQPHFLFNTLNSISALIQEDPEQAERTIERLAGLLRSSLGSERTIPLEQELKLVADYLEIQRVRFGDRLRFEMPNSLDGLTDTPIPPFAVQTLVENAVKHVAEQRRNGASVHVTVARAGTDVVVDVTDDGPGFNAESEVKGHGLDLLRGRLRAVYGDRAALEFLRQSDGMTVRLRTPAE